MPVAEVTRGALAPVRYGAGSLRQLIASVNAPPNACYSRKTGI